MTIYFQHVGEQGGRRDFPKTIGTSTDGLVRFNIDDVPEVTANLSADDRQNLENMLRKEVPTGFQIWGIPSGAKSILANLRREDWLLLLLSDGPGGSFYYGGRVVYRPEKFRGEESGAPVQMRAYSQPVRFILKAVAFRSRQQPEGLKRIDVLMSLAAGFGIIGPPHGVHPGATAIGRDRRSQRADRQPLGRGSFWDQDGRGRTPVRFRSAPKPDMISTNWRLTQGDIGRR